MTSTRVPRHGVAGSPGACGTGLGLALARELAELHGGSIRVESEVGVGSTFIVRLDLPDERAEADSAVVDGSTADDDPIAMLEAAAFSSGAGEAEVVAVSSRTPDFSCSRA